VSSPLKKPISADLSKTGKELKEFCKMGFSPGGSYGRT